MAKIRFGMVADKSGSMSTIREQTFAGINQQIQSIKENGEREGADVAATLEFFDDHGNQDGFEFVYTNKPSSELQPIAYEQFVPRGMTALNDAIGKMVQRLQETNPDPDTLFVVGIFTDGGENSSREFNRQQIMTMIETLQKTEKWTFTFVGAGGINEVQGVAANYAIPAANVMAYDGSKEGSALAYSKMSAACTGVTTRSLRGESLMAVKGVNFFEAAENFEK